MQKFPHPTRFAVRWEGLQVHRAFFALLPLYIRIRLGIREAIAATIRQPRLTLRALTIALERAADSAANVAAHTRLGYVTHHPLPSLIAP